MGIVCWYNKGYLWTLCDNKPLIKHIPNSEAQIVSYPSTLTISGYTLAFLKKKNKTKTNLLRPRSRRLGFSKLYVNNVYSEEL
jgi:hypothetical protein